MAIEQFDAVIALAGGVNPDGSLPEKVEQRMDTALALVHAGAASDLIVTGGWGFLTAEPPVLEADAMVEYAVKGGVDREAVHPEGGSHDTIGSACLTKREVVMPRGWSRFLLVTSESHLPRAEDVFDHVFGDGYEFQGVAAPEKTGIKTRTWEYAASLLFQHVLAGTERGDDLEIFRRLEELAPVYGPTTNKQLLMRGLTNVFRRKNLLEART